MRDLYRDRRYAEGYPDLEARGVEWYAKHQDMGVVDGMARGTTVMDLVARLIDLSGASGKVAVPGNAEFFVSCSGKSSGAIHYVAHVLACFCAAVVINK